MTCISPPELSEAQLLRYLDGEASPEVAAHVGRCEHCRERAQSLARFQARLARPLYRHDCPSADELGDYTLGLLAPDAAERVARHAAQCPHCARELADFRSALAQQLPGGAPGALEQVKRLVAHLAGALPGQEENRLQPFRAPARGTGTRGAPGAAVPRTYEAEGVRIRLLSESDAQYPQHISLLGLVTGLETPGLQAELWQAETLAASAAVDAGGNFALADLVPGHYDLVLRQAGLEIHVPALEV